jgi:hypothetical protein
MKNESEFMFSQEMAAYRNNVEKKLVSSTEVNMYSVLLPVLMWHISGTHTFIMEPQEAFSLPSRNPYIGLLIHSSLTCLTYSYASLVFVSHKEKALPALGWSFPSG